MKRNLLVLAVMTVIGLSPGAAWAATEFKSDQAKRSYAIGASMAKNIKQQGISVDPTLVSQGLLDTLGDKSQLPDSEIGAILQKFQEELRQKKIDDFMKLADENTQRGAAFMAENGKKEGVNILAGGTQYKVLHAGSGRIPTDGDTVLCNYRGTLVDGREFDASQPGRPASFKVGQVIPGWREALKQMPVGSKWQLVIPANQAYGERGAGNKIGPEETLVFEVELVGIQ
jgi:FKBP-type peptidyl-prolyl cis-trans isomerase FklB